jgi:hypothetical protein
MNLEHLDITDIRRNDLFADVTCRDCAHLNIGNPNLPTCLAHAAVRRALEDALRGMDVAVPLLTFEPDIEAQANHCPGLWPSLEYLTELANQERDAAMTYREDMNRRSAVRMGMHE